MTANQNPFDWYPGKRALVTGGLGFIGSNLALELLRLGADVTVIDSLLPGCGGNPANLAAARGRISTIRGDISDDRVVADALRHSDVVFNLAGEVSHTHSMLYPERDLQANTIAHLRFLDACARFAPGRRVVYTGTRQVYGRPRALPVREDHPTDPVDFNGVHKLAAEQYHVLLTRLGRIDGIVLRLTNVYGPRQAIGHCCQGVLAVFFRRALQGKPITVFGDGAQLRDPLYAGDGCEALLRAGAVVEPRHRTINIGSPQGIPLLEIASEISLQADLPAPRLQPFPPDRARIDIGSYSSSGSLSYSVLGWKPHTTLQEGVRRTLDYYRAHGDEYFDLPGIAACCSLSDGIPAGAAA